MNTEDLLKELFIARNEARNAFLEVEDMSDLELQYKTEIEVLTDVIDLIIEMDKKC
jgi:hypothetical protein